MKITLSCIGKFHHFFLARELESRGALERIFTGYPRWKLRDEQVSQRKISTYPWIQAPLMGLGRYGLRGSPLSTLLTYYAHRTLGGYVASKLPACDILVALSSSGLEAARVQKSRQGRFVCDRASSHIRFQHKILTEEFGIWGRKFRGIDSRTMQRELDEYALADLITVPSRFARRSFIEEGVPLERVATVPFGVDLSRFEKVGTPATGEFQVLFVGQVGLRKGIPYLLEAYRRFNHPRKKLVIIGAVLPEIREFLVGLDSSVSVLGAQPQPKLKEWMSRSHVMVLPSIEEGLAYVQAQAMACGCPVIATTNTGAEDLFDDGQEGFIVPIRNVDAIVQRLEQLAASPALQESMSERGLAKVRGYGGWRNYGENYMSLMTALISAGRQSGR